MADSYVIVVTIGPARPGPYRHEAALRSDGILGGCMRQDLAMTAVHTRPARPAKSIACLAFVTVLGAAFWAGAVWIAATILQAHGGF